MANSRVIADLHVHSRYSRACSPNISIEEMERTALEKGISLVGTGDFTHPSWLAELKSKLEFEKGVFKVKGSSSQVRFILSTEVSTVYVENNSVKKVHHCILMPSFEAVDALIELLRKVHAPLESDGRPTLQMTSAELVEAAVEASKDAFVFPAHLWTPFYGALGQNAGFESIKEVYKDMEKYIYAVETGLSSDPKMNWRVSSLDKYALISNSDMHSLAKMGRESNVLQLEEGYSYKDVISAIKYKDSSKFKKTVEFYPEEGKYHYDGHRECGFSLNPEEKSIRVCPVCGKPLVVGVLHRVNDLADYPTGRKPENAIPYINLVPLEEIIAYAIGKPVASRQVRGIYEQMIKAFGTEFDALSEANIDDIARESNDRIAQAISNVRENRIRIKPGYNGVFGKLYLIQDDVEDGEGKEEEKRGQKMLF
ncbi:MAG: endonuclease Q family protein [Candidatus Micrarchaeia archaeon]